MLGGDAVTPLVRIVIFAAGAAVGLALAMRGLGRRRGLSVFADQFLRATVIGAVVGSIAPVLSDVGWCLILVICCAVGWFFRTSIETLNFLVLQWFGVRLLRVIESPHGRVTVLSASPGFDAAAEVVSAVGGKLSWTLLRWVWPLTGWWSEYLWIARRR